MPSWLRWVAVAVAGLLVAAPRLPSVHSLAYSCTKGDLLPHPHDCTKYLECREDTLLLLTCLEDESFDAASSSCRSDAQCRERKDEALSFGAVYLGRAVIEPCAGFRPGFKIAHPDNCSLFYQCTQSGSALFRCPANLMFHSHLKVCVWPQQVVCEPGSIVPPPPPPPIPPPPPPPLPPPPVTVEPPNPGGPVPGGPGPGGPGPGGPGPGDGDDPGLDDICEPSCFLDLRCPLDCDPIVPPKLLPHPSRCDAFFRCNPSGYSCEVVCPPGMWFSSIFQRCVYAELSDCVPVTRPICPEPNCEPNPDCPEIDTDPPTKLPVPGDDSSYFICRDGSACLVRCPPGLIWNFITLQCDRPEDVETPEPPTPEPPTPEPPTPEPPTPEPPTPEPPTPEPPTPEPPTPEPPTPEPPTPEPPTPEPPTPEPPTPEPPTPEPPTPEPPTPEPPTPEPPTPEPPTTTPGDCPTCPPTNCFPDPRCPLCEKCEPTFFPHENCEMYYKCNFGSICEMKCPPGLHFNSRERVCDWPEQAGCAGPPIPDYPPEDAGACQPHPGCPPNNNIEWFLPHPDSCGLFYKCSWGNACLKECPNGLHWSITHSRCEWPNLAGCDPTIPPNDPSCPTCPCEPCRSKRNACHPSPRCPQGYSWFTRQTFSFGHEHYCDQFYECLSGQACVLDCPPGLEYSGGVGRCDVPSVAKCSLYSLPRPFDRWYK